MPSENSTPRAAWRPVLDHVALTVPELDAGVRFFTELFDAEELYRLGPFDAAELPPSDDGRDWTDAHLNVPDARVTLAMLALPGGSLLELFHYERPDDAGRTPPRNCDVGGHHLAFKVQDLEAASRRIEERGLKVMAGPIAIEEGPAAGTRVQYFLAPWGLQLELTEYERPPWLEDRGHPAAVTSSK